MENTDFERCTPVKLHFTSCSTSEYDSGDNTPIILVHGLFATNSTWNRVKSQLSKRTNRKVYAVDLRNHGNTEYGGEFTVNHMACDLFHFMIEQDIPKAVIVSHSIGGRIAMELALRKPEMVEKLVVEDITISDSREDLRMGIVTLSKQMLKFVSQLKPSTKEKDAHKLLSRMIHKYASLLGISAQLLPAFYKDPKTGEFKFDFNMPATIDIIENIERMHVNLTENPVYPGEVLFIKGEESAFPIIEDRELILKHFPQTQFETLTKAHHVTHTECPEEFARIVSDFINS